MRLLLDNNIPLQLKRLLPFDVEAAFELGWAELVNGRLLEQAERAGFDCLLTADQNLPYQNNLRGRKIAVVVVNTNKRRDLARQLDPVIAALNRVRAGEVSRVTLEIPPLRRRPPPERSR